MRLGTSLRVRPVADALAAAEREAPRWGLSRVTDITRLDRLGLPVCASVRPRGRTLRVHAGKGLTLQDARVGALMEAIEVAAAEAGSEAGPETVQPLADWLARWRGALALADFAPLWGVRAAPSQPLGLVHCESLAEGGAQPLPAELVLLPHVPADGRPLFGWSSNGLASGATTDEATLHALFEVLERDTLALHQARDASAWVDPASLPAPFDGWAAAWAALGVRLIVRALSGAAGLPCFQAYLHDDAVPDLWLAVGSGLHADPAIALSRAVCEAAQSRLTVIHGGRDDIVELYAHRAARTPRQRRADQAARLAKVDERSRRIAFADVPPLPLGDDPAAALAALLPRLAAAGLRHVYRRRFAPALIDLAVVRVVVPRCELLEGTAVRMGARAIARALGRDRGRGG